jgi:peptidoglycan/LPS O-acetylase OafA/YrhL
MYAAVSGSPPKEGTIDWWFFYTPLHLLWAGGDAVLLFFVLSGYVLALPAVRKGTEWLDSSYYPRRLLRLYLPVFGVLIVGVVLHEVVSHSPVVGASPWLNNHSVAPTVKENLEAASLLWPRVTDWSSVSVLWSLCWEVWFSILLPGLLLLPLFTAARPKFAPAATAALLFLVCVGVYEQNSFLTYIPGFVVGSMVAFHLDKLMDVMRRIPVWVATAVGVLLLLAPDEMLGIWNGRDIALAMCFAGAAVLVVSALTPGWFRQGLSSRPARWLGSRSFSLYLVHEPVVVVLALLLGGRPPLLVLLAVGVPAALLASELFWRAVESPTIVWARRVGLLFLSIVSSRSHRASAK